eukprot:scaffold69248_cov48-Phaeocystis_antarctica.AAC.1
MSTLSANKSVFKSHMHSREAAGHAMVAGAAAEHRPLLPAGTGATRPALSVAEVLLTLHGVEVTRGVELEVVELHVA